MLEIGTLLMIAYVIFRPLTAPRTPPSPAARRVASDLVRAHGADTLAFFKLRADGHYIFSEDRRAFVAYAIENGVLLLSGDPVGPPDALPGLLGQVRQFADARGLKLGALGASEGLCPLYEELGLRTMYVGDEAVVDAQSLLARGPTDPQGAPVGDAPRPRRDTRPSCTSCERSTRARSNGSKRWSSSGARARPSAASRWRWTRSGASTTTRRSWCWRATRAGAIRGVLHFVPCYGRPAVSLSFMRRDPSTPNGLTEFLVVKAIELLRDARGRGAVAQLRGVREVDAQPGEAARAAGSAS